MEGKIFLNPDIVKKVILGAQHDGLKKIIFSGGEPLSYPYISDLILFCSNKNIETTLYSTGITKNSDISSGIIKELRNAGLSRIIFSLFGYTAEKHEHITRVSGSFNLTIDAIKEASEYGFKVELHFVPFKQNYRLLEKLCILGRSLNIVRISILRFVSHGRGTIINDVSALAGKEYKSFRGILKKIMKEYPGLIRLGSPFNFLLLRDIEKCDAGINQIVINPKGYVFPCDAFKNVYPKDLGFDDELNSIIDNSISSIWENSKYLNYIRNIINKEREEPCSSCKNLKKCGSGCMAQKFIRNNSITGKDPDCMIDWGKNV